MRQVKVDGREHRRGGREEREGRRKSGERRRREGRRKEGREWEREKKLRNYTCRKLRGWKERRISDERR